MWPRGSCDGLLATCKEEEINTYEIKSSLWKKFRQIPAKAVEAVLKYCGRIFERYSNLISALYLILKITF